MSDQSPSLRRRDFLAAIFASGVSTPSLAAGLVSPYPILPERPPRPNDAELRRPVIPPLRTLGAGSRYAPNDPTRSTVDPLLEEANIEEMRPVRDFCRQVVQYANRYRASGNPADAALALSWLHHWASAEALSELTTPQAHASQGWTLSALAFAYLQIKEAPGLSAEMKAETEQWLGNMADTLKAHMDDQRGRGGNNNHLYWAALAVAATAIATQNQARFNWGMQGARRGIEQIAPDGTLPLELQRGPRARSYHVFATEPLVAMAELGMLNGTNLYAARQDALHRLVNTATRAATDPRQMEQLTGIQQAPYDLHPSRFAWAGLYQRRFPENKMVENLLGNLSGTLAKTQLGGRIEHWHTAPTPVRTR